MSAALDATTPPIPQRLRPTDGSEFAWASAGSGRPAILMLPGWISNIGVDWGEHGRGRLVCALASRRRILLYDAPGVGCAARHGDLPTFDQEVDDLIRLISLSGEHQVAVFGASLSGPLAMALAARYPSLVSHLILFATRPSLMSTPEWPDGLAPSAVDALVQLLHADWGLGSRALAALLMTETSEDERRWFVGYQRSTADGSAAADLLRSRAGADVTPLLPSICSPTLILHRRSDPIISVTNAVRLASAIPGAQLVVLDGSSNLPFAGEIDDIAGRIEAFVDPRWRSLTSREMQALAGAADGLANREIAVRLGVREVTVARHLATAYQKLGVHSRGAAVALARRVGLLQPTGLGQHRD